jgi:hypothetical protein
MKFIKSFLWILVVLPVFLFSSCEKQPEVEQEGTLELGIITNQMDGQLKSVLEDSIDIRTHYVVVSVANETGELVLDDEQLELYKFGGQWVTKKIELKTGIYEVTKFFIVDPNGNVLYAAPLEGSPKAYLVNNPLPLPFEVMKDQVTRVVPEVLRVIEDPPEAFGYVTFSYSVVRILNFFIAVYIDNPRIMAPTMWTDAKLTVIAPDCNYANDSLAYPWEDPSVFPCDQWKHVFKLEPRINKVTVRDYMGYILIIEKEGFDPVKLRMSRDELLKAGPDNPLLIGLPVEEYQVLVLQPGPEDGKDAMINRGMPENNFGKHPYFEADGLHPETSNLEYHLTRSFIQFDLGQLPKSATIRKAVLTLYYPNSYYLDSIKPFINAEGVRSDLDSLTPWPVDYLAVLQKIITPWEEHEVTWKTQPKTTTEGQVFIPRIFYIAEVDCYDCFVPPVSESFDVTELLMPDEAGNMSYGMMLKLFNEEGPEILRYASSDFEMITTADGIVNSLWPKLEIYYTLPNW